MKPDLIFHANPSDNFAVLGIADQDDQAAAPVFFAKVLPEYQEQVDPFSGLVEHLSQLGTWYEVSPARAQGHLPTTNEVQDQAAMMPFELLLLAYAGGREDEANEEQGQQVSHPGALAMLAALGAAAQASFQSSYGPGAAPPPPPQKSTLQQLVEMLRKQPPPLKHLPPPPPPPEEPAAPVQESNSVFDSELANLDDFLNDARFKAGGL